ncbi:MAG TPA: hypothetical protein VFS55_08315 [Dokdonella sp.]|nr:hypothetical protein [Dokdonella sp.]
MNSSVSTGAGASAAESDASLALRIAQRAFAPLLERHVRHTTFRFAQLRSAARRALSALSADDRVRLARWLALLCAAVAIDAREVAEQRLARIDAALAAAVTAARTALGERLIALQAGAVAA